MSVYYQDDTVTLHQGDCLDVLASLPDASVDAVVTDPPYGLGFMGKAWDAEFTPSDMPTRRTAALDAVNAGASRQGGRQRASVDYQKRQARDARSYGEWCEQWAAECLRVLKPGGELILVNHIGAEGGPRKLFELAFAPLARRLGWRPEFPWARLVNWAARHGGIDLIERRPMPPMGHFSLIRYRKL